MPHFSPAGNDEYVCQVCARVYDSIAAPPEWRPDVTGHESAGNVCPSCLKNANAKEYFFIPRPEATGSKLNGYDAYKCPGFPKLLKWSAKFPLPNVGERIYLAINSIGYAAVKGYCDSHGFLGVMASPENPPAWYKKQVASHYQETRMAVKYGPERAKVERIRVWPQWILDGVCVAFGAEIRMQK